MLQLKIPSDGLGRAAVAAMAAGVVLLVIAGFALFGGSSDDDALAGPQDTGDEAFEPYQGQTTVEDLTDVRDGGSLPSDGQDGSKTSGADPFAAQGSDQGPHKVTITFTSDGALYAGWRYRTKGGEGLEVANRTLTVGKTVNGGLPVVQAAVQVLSNATYATCTITIDGVETNSQTARGPNRVVVCLS